MNAVSLHHYCEACGHVVEAHDRVTGCDHEVQDWGDTDCGCTRYRVEVSGPWVRCADCGEEHVEAATDTHKRLFCEANQQRIVRS